MRFLCKPFEDLRGGTVDMGIMGKPTATFADVDASQLAGPLVHVAEEVSVYRL